MKRAAVIVMVFVLALTPFILDIAVAKDASDLLKQGLVGARAGAVGGAASGAEGGDV